MNRAWTLPLALLGMVVIGCSPAPTKEAAQAANPPVEKPQPSSNTAMASMETKTVKGIVKDGLYVNPKTGVPLCPVTGDDIAKGKEVGKTVYKGVEYHFCCAGCPEEFKAKPSAYAVKGS